MQHNARRKKCALTPNRSEELKMANLRRKSIYPTVFAKVLVWGALAVCGTATPALGQNAVAGTFTLNENARFGNTLLGAGQYKFSIEPIGNIQSIRSIQQGAGHLVLVVVRPEKSGPVASIFAMASPSGHAGEVNELVLGSEKTETLAQTMNLPKEGLVVDFNWSTPKSKSQVIAQQAVPLQTAAFSRSGAN
jgi:hypothetical protein